MLSRGLLLRLFGTTVVLSAGTFGLLAALAEPKMQLSDKVVYVSSTENRPVKKIIKIKNVGSADLAIGPLVQSCSCLEASLDKIIVSPHQEAALSISAMPGRDASVAFQTNDPAMPVGRVEVKSEWNLPFRSNLKVLDLGVVSADFREPLCGQLALELNPKQWGNAPSEFSIQPAGKNTRVSWDFANNMQVKVSVLNGTSLSGFAPIWRG